jgi:serine/threonine-protein kinase
LGPIDHNEFEVASRGWTPGDVVGRYRMLSRIALGGMAEIWLALQQGLKGFERVVVVKRISEALSADESFVEMFLDEARIAAQLNHPNIVQIYELGEHKGAYYIAMEYLHGEDLAAVVRASVNARVPVSPEFAARVVASAAEGLASAHARMGLDGKPLNVVHRDVSPQNIFITYDGIVKVLDFGVAKARIRANTTQGGQLKGKFSYMSPEQARGAPVDARADVWGLGVVLFEAATHTRLFEGKEEQLAVREAVLYEPIPSARARNSLIPSELDAIISCALERDPNVRTPSAETLQADLESWLKGRKDAPNTAALSATMHELFGDRIAKKTQLVESVRVGEVRLAQLPVVLRPPVDRSMPDGPITRTIRSTKGKLAMFTAALLASFVVSAIGFYAVPRTTAVLKVTSAAGGALVLLDGEEAGGVPLTLPDVEPGPHEVVLEVDGRRSDVTRFTVQAGETLALQLTAPPAEGPPSEVAEPAGVIDVEPPSEAAEPVEAPGLPFAERPQKRPVRVRRAPKGKLSLETVPWTQVSFGGRVLGDTPLLERQLPAGRHVLKLSNPERGITTSIEVEISAGQTTVMKLKL